jgi:hypothetical protein
MRLTNTIRDSFIRAAMHDVPKEMDHSEEIRKIVTKDFVEKLHPKVRAVYDDPSICDWLKSDHNNYGEVSVRYPAREQSGWGSKPKLTPSVQKKVDELAQKKKDNDKLRDDLESKLRRVAYSVSTRKQLVDALPEFEKYLPEDEAKAICTLPVVTNVVADFVKAGWPTKKAGKK